MEQVPRVLLGFLSLRVFPNQPPITHRTLKTRALHRYSSSILSSSIPTMHLVDAQSTT